MNLASRLCDEALPGQILVSERVFSDVEELVEAEAAGAHKLKGFDLPVGAYSIAGVRAPIQVPR
jgi:class 3 adenylate cyclase